MKFRYILLILAMVCTMGAYAQHTCSSDKHEHHTCSGDGKECDEAKKWLENKEWANGFNVAPDQSVNAKEFKEQYQKNKALWDKVFAFLATTDLNALPVGTTDIEKDRAWVTVSEYIPRTADKVKIESHRKFIDLQYTLSGNEKMGLARDEKPGVLMDYNDKREVAFWTSDKIDYFKAGPDTFFLFFPADLHQPSVLDGEPVKSKKIVVKIEYAN